MLFAFLFRIEIKIRSRPPVPGTVRISHDPCGPGDWWRMAIL